MEEGSLFQRMRQILQSEETTEEIQDKKAAELIRNVFRYMDKDAKDIMTHRRDIVAIDGEESLENTLRFMLEEKYSRFPVYAEDIDGITGIFHLRDAMTCYLDRSLRMKPVKELKDYIRPVMFIPETKQIDTLFKDMQAEKNHIAVVLDEYGQTSGLVALEDILEEIVGNIMDEYDEEDENIIRQADGSYITHGFVALEELEDLIGLAFDKDEYETLNGFLIAQLDRIPGEEEHCMIEYEGYSFAILSVDNNAIQSVRIAKSDTEC